MSTQQAAAAKIPRNREFVASTAEYWEKRLAEHWGIEGVGNIGLGKTYNEWQYHQRRSVFIRSLRSLPVQLPGASVLDIGSGIGFWLSVWRSLGVGPLTGVDITQVSVDQLHRAFPNTRMLQMDISSAKAVELLDAKYEFISAMDVLSHIVSDQAFSRALANVSQLLKPGGYFVFTENLPHKEKERNFNSIQANRTLAVFTQELGRHNLRIAVRTPVFFLMMTPLDTQTNIPRKLWRIFMEPLRHLPMLGKVYGPALFLLDQVLTRVFREGPSTELVICQKT